MYSKLFIGVSTYISVMIINTMINFGKSTLNDKKYIFVFIMTFVLETFTNFSSNNFNEQYPYGVVILGQVITDPGKTGVIYSAERIIRDYEYPSAEVLKAYGR